MWFVAGILSAPKVMVGMRQTDPSRENVFIFEIDRRFNDLYPHEFVEFDCNCPENLPQTLHGTFDMILLDPPFLNQATFEMYWEAIRLLRRHAGIPVLGCTGRVMLPVMASIFGMRPNSFSDIRFESKLAVPFYFYTNYESQRFGPFLTDDEV